jgi:FkbM family methyltransferase
VKIAAKPSFRRAVVGLCLLSVGILALLRFSETGRILAVRSYVRFERLWSRDVPIAALAGAVKALEPALTAIGLVGPVRLEIEPGVSLRLDPADAIARTVLISRTNSWEPEVWDALCDGLVEGSVAIDVGAHIGVDTLKLARVVGISGRVVAVEPNPITLLDLRSNIQASSAANVTVAPVALSDAEGQLTLFDSRSTGNSGSSSLSAENAGDSAASYTVRTRTLDDVVAELGLARIDVIKADVEGAELLVLRGATTTLARFHPKLVLEVVPRQLESMGASVEALESFLAQHGYARHRWVDYKNKEYLFGTLAGPGTGPRH